MRTCQFYGYYIFRKIRKIFVFSRNNRFCFFSYKGNFSRNFDCRQALRKVPSHVILQRNNAVSHRIHIAILPILQHSRLAFCHICHPFIDRIHCHFARQIQKAPLFILQNHSPLFSKIAYILIDKWHNKIAFCIKTAPFSIKHHCPFII